MASNNIITSDSRFHAAYLSSESLTNSYSFITGFEGVDLLNPATSQAASSYVIGTVAGAFAANYTLTASSDNGPHNIISAAGAAGTVTFTGMTLNYTAPADFCGYDSVDVIVENALGELGTATVAFLVNGTAEEDSLALVNLYNSNGGSSWVYTATSHDHYSNIFGNSEVINIANAGTVWNLSQPMSGWHGVTTNSSGCVTRLELIDMNVSGGLPDINLPSLEGIFIRGNNLLAGTSAPNLTKTPLLTRYFTANNGFVGSFPDLQLDSLILIEVNLENINSFPNFTSLPQLQELKGTNGVLSIIPDFSNTLW